MQKITVDSKDVWVYVIMRDLYIQEMNGSIDSQGCFKPFYTDKVYKQDEYFLRREVAEVVRYKLAQDRYTILLREMRFLKRLEIFAIIVGTITLMYSLIIELLSL